MYDSSFVKFSEYTAVHHR